MISALLALPLPAFAITGWTFETSAAMVSCTAPDADALRMVLLADAKKWA